MLSFGVLLRLVLSFSLVACLVVYFLFGKVHRGRVMHIHVAVAARYRPSTQVPPDQLTCITIEFLEMNSFKILWPSKYGCKASFCYSKNKH